MTKNVLVGVIGICGAKASRIIVDELYNYSTKAVPIDEPASSPSITHSHNVHGESWRNKGKMPWRKC